MATYEITSYKGGLSDYEDKGIFGSFKFGSGLAIRKDKDTLSCQQALVDEGLLGESMSASRSPSASASSSLSRSPSPSSSASPSAGSSNSPSRSPSASASPSASNSPSSSNSPSVSPSSALTSVFRDLIRFFVKCTDGNTYGFGNTGYIYKRTTDGDWSVVYKDTDGAIKGAAEWFSVSGKAYLYWATNTKLKRKPIPGLSNWNDVNLDSGWPKTNLTSADWHTMREAGGSLMIANSAFLALVGYDDSYTNEALDLIPGNIAKTLVERNGRTIVGTGRASDPTKGINAAIDAEYPLAQIGDDGNIFFANMTDKVPAKRFPGGGIVNPGGVCNEVDELNFFEWEQTALSWIDKQTIGNLTYWGVYNADIGKNGIYSYGRTTKNKPFVLNLDYLLEVDEIGALVITDGILLASYRDGTEFGVKAVDSTTKVQGIYEALDFKAPIKRPITITNWQQAELLMSPLPSGTSVEFWYRLDNTGSFIQAKTASGATSFTTASSKKAVFRIVAEAEIFEAKVVLNPSGNNSPEVRKIRVTFV